MCLITRFYSMPFLCQYTASTTWVSGVECLFLRSTKVLWWIKVSFCNKWLYWSDTLLQCPELLAGCHSSVTALTANTTQITKICTQGNLFFMVRIAYSFKSTINYKKRPKKKLEITRRTDKNKIDMRCRAIGRNFDCGCWFLQDTYNGVTFNMTLSLQKQLRNFSVLWIHYPGYAFCSRWNVVISVQG